MKKIVPIDVNDTLSYPMTFTDIIQASKECFVDFKQRDIEITMLRNKGGLTHLTERNENWDACEAIIASASICLNEFDVLGWLYTRLTNDDAQNIVLEGLQPSTQALLEMRLSKLVDDANISDAEAKEIFCQSPLSDRTQRISREGRVWFFSKQHCPEDTAVKSLLGNWGGEVTYMHLTDNAMKSKIRRIGSPFEIKASLPISATNKAHCFAKAMIANFLNSLQLDYPRVIDFYVRGKVSSDRLLLNQLSFSS